MACKPYTSTPGLRRKTLPTVMVNFICQLGQAVVSRYVHIILDISVRVFLNEHIIQTSRLLVKQIILHIAASSNQLTSSNQFLSSRQRGAL